MQEIVYHKNYELENNYFWFISRQNILTKIIRKLVKLNKNAEILDIGCGTGGFASALKDSVDNNVLCLDTEEIALEYCKKRGLNNIYKGLLTDFDFSKNNIEFALMLDVIEHIENDSEVVSQVYDTLQEGGYFLATVPAYQWMWSHHDIIHMHYRRYSKKHFEDLLKSQGFQIIYSSYFNTFLFPIVWLKRQFDRLLKKEKEDGNPIDEVPKIINSVFEKIFSLESLFIPKISLPFGLSIVVLAKKGNI